MHVVDYVFLAGWVAFWVYWLGSAVGVKPGRSNWTRWAAVRVVLILILVLFARLFSGHQVTTGPWLQGIGLALFVLGLGLAVWARVYLGQNWGAPMSEKDEPELVRTGPYRRVRHPIYSGIILAMVGTTVAVSLYWLVAVLVLGGYFILSAIVEESNMARLFPDEYPDYKRSTKMLIPFVF